MPAPASFFAARVAEVFLEGRTTIEERERVAREWCAGAWEAHHALARERGLLPMALLVGSLLDVEHPLLVDNAGCMIPATYLGCTIPILHVMLQGAPIPFPEKSEEVYEREASVLSSHQP